MKSVPVMFFKLLPSKEFWLWFYFIPISFLWACNRDEMPRPVDAENTGPLVERISYKEVEVDLIIDKPDVEVCDVLLVFRGTVRLESLAMNASMMVLDRFRELSDREDMAFISVVYPEENLLFGDNIEQAEAALLWIKERAKEAWGWQPEKIWLAGHSQGGYLVTRLNTMHPTDGVIANAPGPLNLLFRCQLEENGQVPSGMECELLNDTYGTTAANPLAYMDRSLLRFTDGHLANILFIQGLQDGPIHMHSWAFFKEKMMNCSDCQARRFLELDGLGHNALFVSDSARKAFNEFIKK